MSCFNPNLMEARLDPATGVINYIFLGPAKYDNPLDFGCISDLETKGSYKFVVPCGKCLGCHIDYSREWANRMIIELQDNSSAVFVTLTYNNEKLPLSETSGNPTLRVRDLQLFFKRLRKAFPEKKIRYYIAGEYGPTTLRPHYHAIIYGLSLDDFPDLRCFGCNELKDPYYTSPKFEKIWGNGFIMMSSVTYKTCAYVARYVLKKHYSSDDEFNDRGVDPEFNLSSRKPGIGMLRADEMVLSGFNSFSFDGRDGVHEISLPKSFIRHCKNSGNNVDKCVDICYNRSMDAYSRLCSNLLFTEKSYYDFLQTKEAKLSGKIKLLPERK